MTETTHNSSAKLHRVSCLRENLTSSSYGEELETGPTAWSGTAPVPYPTAMADLTRKRDELIAHLEAALALAEEVGDSVTAYLIETALDQARADDVAFGAALRPEAEADNEARRRKTRAEAFRPRTGREKRDT